MSSINSITIFGSSDDRELGDSAMIGGLTRAIDQALARKVPYEIPTARSSFVRKSFDSDIRTPRGLTRFFPKLWLSFSAKRSVVRTDLTLVCGAALESEALTKALPGILASIENDPDKACKLALCNLDLDNTRMLRARDVIRKLAKHAEFITVCNDAQVGPVTELGGSSSKIVAIGDFALNAPVCKQSQADEILAKFQMRQEEDILAICPGSTAKDRGSQSERVEQLFTLLNDFLDRFSVPVLFVATCEDDQKISEQLVSKMRAKRKVGMISTRKHNYQEVGGVLGRVALFLSQPFQPAALATAQHTPVISLGSGGQMAGLLESLGVHELALDLGNISPRKVLTKLEYAWRERSRIRCILDARVPLLKSKVQCGAKLVAALDRGANLERECGTLRESLLDLEAHGVGEQAVA